MGELKRGVSKLHATEIVTGLLPERVFISLRLILASILQAMLHTLLGTAAQATNSFAAETEDIRDEKNLR